MRAPLSVRGVGNARDCGSGRKCRRLPSSRCVLGECSRLGATLRLADRELRTLAIIARKSMNYNLFGALRPAVREGGEPLSPRCRCQFRHQTASWDYFGLGRGGAKLWPRSLHDAPLPRSTRWSANRDEVVDRAGHQLRTWADERRPDGSGTAANPHRLLSEFTRSVARLVGHQRARHRQDGVGVESGGQLQGCAHGSGDAVRFSICELAADSDLSSTAENGAISRLAASARA